MLPPSPVEVPSPRLPKRQCSIGLLSVFGGGVLLNSGWSAMREASLSTCSLSSLAQALNIDDDQVLRLAKLDQNPEGDQESG